MKKEFSQILCLALLVGCLALFTNRPEDPRAGKEPVQIRIISTSDSHGKILPYDYALNEPDPSGSLSQISSALQELKDENTILVDVGDTIQGNAADLFVHDPIHPMVRAQNLMKIDAWVPGNHEFNFGMDVLRSVIGQHECSVLCGNVYNRDGSRLAEPYVILERAGVRIGIIGVVTPNILRWDRTNLEREGMRVTDPVEEIRVLAGELRDRVDVLIAACHMDCENELGLEDSGVYDLADRVPELDLILAAHGHKAIEGIWRNGVLITENGSGGRTISLITLTLEKKEEGGFALAERESCLAEMAEYPEDPLISRDPLILEADRRAREDASRVIGILTNEALSPPDEVPGIPQARLGDTALIRLINDVQMYYTGAEIAAASLSEDDSNLYAGEIRNCDMARIYRFTNTLYRLRMTGSQIRRWMEWSYSYINTFHEGDLTISFSPGIRDYNYDMFSGLRYEVDISGPAGDRIRKLALADGSPLEDREKYEVAVNNYRAAGHLLAYGAIFEEGEELPELVEADVRGDLGGIREMIAAYLTQVCGVKGEDGLLRFTLEDVTEENARWKLTGYSWDEEKHARAVRLIREGKLSLPGSEDGSAANIRSITETDLEAFD